MTLNREQSCLEYVKANAIKNNPKSVLDAIDKFCYDVKGMMNVGDDKGPIVDGLIFKHKPKVMVELGGYVGYSAIRFGIALSSINPDAKYFSFELNPEYVSIMKELIELSGLKNITVVTGAFASNFQKLKTDFGVDTVDFFFLDHWKDAYLSDIKLIEKEGLLHDDSVVVADNVIYPGAPEYLEYVRGNPNFYHNETITSCLEYTKGKVVDALQVSIYRRI
ncbi:hypothetical protein HK099_005283 [Clydaea vesicula]|uniref:catechol O-methyltransferase n=1 Tax=Clydaea vesicula TaxID=447962 RepID=A0AAD5TZH2_9FUNG|nr:hypothetical protein HK099_005283 [Clydaea vesicula]KAJ3380891.1 hypothetical protein HDU92_005694 [Lobulomyces angularis]